MVKKIHLCRSPFILGVTHDIIERCFTHELGPGEVPKVAEVGPRNLVGLVSPHAGYEFSGPVAAHAYHCLAVDGKPDVIVIFGPNHTGQGSGLALMREGVWRTPLGDVEIDVETAEKILQGSTIIDVDSMAHQFEHSIEVQLPFLQHLYGSNFKFVPICFLMQDLQSSRDVGQAVGKALKDKNSVVIASSDMTHYEPHELAEKKDKMVLRVAEKIDAQQYYAIVRAQRVSTCGYGPVVAAITAAKMLGARKGRLLCYKTSGDVTGDYSSVVGYAALSFTK
jgi:AmmeMemoRadiSam system protein B